MWLLVNLICSTILGLSPAKEFEGVKLAPHCVSIISIVLIICVDRVYPNGCNELTNKMTWRSTSSLILSSVYNEQNLDTLTTETFCESCVPLSMILDPQDRNRRRNTPWGTKKGNVQISFVLSTFFDGWPVPIQSQMSTRVLGEFC